MIDKERESVAKIRLLYAGKDPLLWPSEKYRIERRPSGRLQNDHPTRPSLRSQVRGRASWIGGDVQVYLGLLAHRKSKTLACLPSEFDQIRKVPTLKKSVRWRKKAPPTGKRSKASLSDDVNQETLFGELKLLIDCILSEVEVLDRVLG